MAFRLPPQVPRRRPSYSAPQPAAFDIPQSQSLSELRETDTAEWVLFSPTQPSTTARTHTTSTERTRTVGASRLSDFGSLDTNTRSAIDQGSEAEGTLDDALDEDGTELDSLDDGLHAFRTPSPAPESPRWAQGPTAQLPAHDGLGSFVAFSQPVQNQLWQYERHNPSRRPELAHRRRSSVQCQLDAIADEERTDADRERWQRIEQWRMDQSRDLLQEIEKATRRRRNSRFSGSNVETVSQAIQSDIPSGIQAASQEQVPEGEHAAHEDESVWQRITRKVIRDLIGIDDSILSVIIGESLPESAELDEPEETDMERRMGEILNQELEASSDEARWETRLLQRIARELGILVNQLCEHPGAFTTYVNMANDVPNQYAGISLSSLPEEGNHLSASAGSAAETATNGDLILSPQFVPTLQDPHREHAAQWGIEDEELPHNGSTEPLFESARHQHDKDYWERELDIMMVFRYLRNRFGRRSSNPDIHNTRRASQDASRRAAIIRQHHPLVARAHSRSQAQIRRQSQYSGPTGVSSPVLRQHLRRPSSSCASQSAKMSAISSRRTLTGSSRNYWDIGGSVDSGSAIAPAPPGIGAWGDV
ncbi:uncharacterized protein BDV17DRAFT_209926 [Aspergillus undulatus]|uniref:uncharacterized protein n=1 Tax=Aspergillus undulatus TaxID=1810928 RepID=UPI003CCDC492